MTLRYAALGSCPGEDCEDFFLKKSNKLSLHMKLGLSCMIVQPGQRHIERPLHVIRLASVLVGSPIDINLLGDRMPRNLVIPALEFDVAVPVVGHDAVLLQERRRCAAFSPMSAS